MYVSMYGLFTLGQEKEKPCTQKLSERLEVGNLVFEDTYRSCWRKDNTLIRSNERGCLFNTGRTPHKKSINIMTISMSWFCRALYGGAFADR